MADVTSKGISASTIKHHRPYFSPKQVQELCEKSRGKLSISQEAKARQHACGFIEALGAKIGFPRKTIATAQSLYHRFHLFFPRKDFSTYDVSLGALYVSTKMHDTLKKPRELLMISYAVRFPELAAKSKSLVGEVDIDPVTAESDRQRLLAVERLILETICFNFTSKMPFPYVIKFGRHFKASKQLTKLAWRLTVDSYRTLVPLQYPPHVVALGCLYLASLLLSFEQPTPLEQPNFTAPHQLAAIVGQGGEWEQKFQAQIEDLEEIAHAVIDLFIQAAQTPSANTSPSTPTSPPDHPSPRNPNYPTQTLYPLPYKSDQLMRLKIAMRETEHLARTRRYVGNNDESTGDNALLGRNDGTVRFLFTPEGLGT